MFNVDFAAAVQKIRIFVVDNGSVDGSQNLVKDIAASNSEIKLISLDRNIGTTRSRNLALRMVSADTDYVCIIDSDTQVGAEAFSSMVEQLNRDTGHAIGLVGPRMHNQRGEYQLSGRNLPTLGIKLRKVFPAKSIKRQGAFMEIPQTSVNNGLQDVPYLLSACWLMPYSTLKTVGLLDENIFYAPEDVDYCVRVHRAGLRVVFCPEADIMHDYQRISQHRFFSRMNLRHISGLSYYFRKYHYLFNARKALL